MLERQHQLQAHRRHKESLKMDYYREAAKYFERESETARHFTSWSKRGPDSYTDWMETKKKEEKLQTRRNNLKQLFERENQLYESELEQKKVAKRGSTESLSLDELRKKLMEKKAEESLYYPNLCRRVKMNYPYSTNDIEKDFKSLGINGSNNGDINSNRETHGSPSSSQRTNIDNNVETSPRSPASSISSHQNRRYAARNEHKSLQDTNIRSDDSFDQIDGSVTPSKHSNSIVNLNDLDQHNDSNREDDSHTDHDTNDKSETQFRNTKDPSNMSLQMYRYLKHIELKHKIRDLCKREYMFVLKQCWDEALRLREMRNELTLLKNKNLYENHDLNIDEDTRQAGLKAIEAREALKKKTTKMFSTLMYSEEAKDTWKQWVREDDEIDKLETNAMRDLLLQELEDEWKNLAIRDKNCISSLYKQVMTKSDLQEEHKLAAIIREMNGLQKDYTDYIVS